MHPAAGHARRNEREVDLAAAEIAACEGSGRLVPVLEAGILVMFKMLRPNVAMFLEMALLSVLFTKGCWGK